MARLRGNPRPVRARNAPEAVEWARNIGIRLHMHKGSGAHLEAQLKLYVSNPEQLEHVLREFRRQLQGPALGEQHLVESNQRYVRHLFSLIGSLGKGKGPVGTEIRARFADVVSEFLRTKAGTCGKQEIVQAAIASLRGVGSGQHAELAAGFLGHRSHLVRLEAIHTISEIGEPRHAGYLDIAARNEPNEHNAAVARKCAEELRKRSSKS